jgi:Peptidase family M1 domain
MSATSQGSSAHGCHSHKPPRAGCGSGVCGGRHGELGPDHLPRVVPAGGPGDGGAAGAAGCRLHHCPRDGAHGERPLTCASDTVIASKIQCRAALAQDAASVACRVLGVVVTIMQSMLAVSNLLRNFEERVSLKPAWCRAQLVSNEGSALQWFGDTTTFAFWGDLWLAEGPATYFEVGLCIRILAPLQKPRMLSTHVLILCRCTA